MDNCECSYFKGCCYEYYPGVFVENGTKIYDKDSIQGKMQIMAFKFAYVYVLSVTNLEKAIKLLDKIIYSNSEEYLPFINGVLLGKDEMIKYLSKSFENYNKIETWFPSNGWVFDTLKKYGVVGSSDKKKKFYRFNVELQYNFISKKGEKSVCGDCYSFYNNKNNTKFYQVKCWFNPNVELLQTKSKLILDYDNVNVVPFPFSNCS
jgi:hypothetical protein